MAAPRRGGGVRAEGPEPLRKYLLEEQWRTKHQRAEPPVPVWEAGESQARTAPRLRRGPLPPGKPGAAACGPLARSLSRAPPRCVLSSSSERPALPFPRVLVSQKLGDCQCQGFEVAFILKAFRTRSGCEGRMDEVVSTLPAAPPAPALPGAQASRRRRARLSRTLMSLRPPGCGSTSAPVPHSREVLL